MSQTTYAQKFPVAFPGSIDGLGTPRVVTRTNSALDTEQVYTVGLPATVDNSATYTVSLTGPGITAAIAASFTTDANATTAELATGLLGAIQASSIVDFFSPVATAANQITLTALRSGISYTLTSPTNASTTNDLTIAEAVAPGSSIPINFGVFVGRNTASPADGFGEARTPVAAANFSLTGVTLSTHANEQIEVGGNQAAYFAGDAMDVLTDSTSTEGVWVRCDAADIVPGDTVFIDTAASNRGGLTKTSTDNIALPAGCALASEAVIDFNQQPIVKVRVRI